jgi:hypothetical protein
MASITYTISDAKLAEFKLGFLKVVPVPTDDLGNPTMSENAWIKEAGKKFFVDSYVAGKKLIAQETTASNTDNSIIT